ncbi:IclR family transcriptional regulator [Qingshengfaniella alkalisoli]|uniref:IclR family transcriptional regulator n=1 Tax=Qingshengfaniella alkalisoli TaxID=2599296 RepID=A0A5B8J0S1_9RHOB|nr:IclR family transcriptional regulator [Qingshengfaniella alkalisoli]QDY70771.1 IclR family transcriptional regulator [Qingshengfaniella alkalisoli]
MTDATPIDKPRSRKTGKRVSGVDRVLQILDFLSDRGEAATAYEIAKAVGAPISTVYVLTDDLIERKMLSRTGDKRVWLGPRVFRYGLAFEAGTDVLTEAKAEMNRLCEELGETVQVCIRDEGQMVVAAMAEGEGHFRVTSHVGTRVPINWTASGRLLVGHLPPERRVELFTQHSRPSPTGSAETDPTILSDRARQDFEDRCAIQLGDSDFSVACIASPVVNGDGSCSATISIVLPETKAREKLDQLTDAVRRSARQIEQAIGAG